MLLTMYRQHELCRRDVADEPMEALLVMPVASGEGLEFALSTIFHVPEWSGPVTSSAL